MSIAYSTRPWMWPHITALNSQTMNTKCKKPLALGRNFVWALTWDQEGPKGGETTNARHFKLNNTVSRRRWNDQEVGLTKVHCPLHRSPFPKPSSSRRTVVNDFFMRKAPRLSIQSRKVCTCPFMLVMPSWAKTAILQKMQRRKGSRSERQENFNRVLDRDPYDTLLI